MNIWRTILAVCVAIFATGCTMIPAYERPASPVPERFPGGNDQSGGAASVMSWKDVFEDERLRQTIEIGLTNNRDLRIALLRVEQSRAQYRVSRSADGPTIDGGLSYARSRASSVTRDQWTANHATASYEVDLFGRVRSLNQQALEKFLATDEGARASQITLVAEVAGQFLALRRADEQAALAERTLEAVKETLHLNQAMFDAGAANELDVRTAEGQLHSARISLLAYQSEAAQARNALELLIGQPLPADLLPVVELDSDTLVAAIPAGLPSETILLRPDILQAEHTLRAANANIGAARAAFFPSIRLTGSVGNTSDAFSTLFKSGTGVWSFSPQITVPIFTSGQNRADLDAAKISARIEVATYEKAIQTAFREVADALVSVDNFAEQAKARQALVATLDRRFELATLRYRQGQDSYFNVLSAQQDLYNARQGRIDARYNGLVSRITLYKALGGGWR